MAFNPFQGIPDNVLYEYALSLALGCGRAKSIAHQPRKGHLCSLFEITKTELQHRGAPYPVPPYYSGNPPKA